MTHLYAALATRVDAWRQDGYPCPKYPALAEVLDFATEDGESGQLRFLRKAQLRALETYWYLRLILDTPRVPALYEVLFPDIRSRSQAMGLVSPAVLETMAYGGGLDAVLQRVRADGEFVRSNGLESLRETLTLEYPSYILALAMGAGKTILMGSIVATEFALALEYPEGPFVQNALIFAPGKTILGALRELADVPFAKLLPARLHKAFAATFKLTFTRDGDSDIPVIAGSSFNLIVTNTEKIRIQKPAGGARGTTRLFGGARDEEAAELANLRLLKIASLPHLAVFSDEAHHTYGQKLLGRWEKDKTTGEPVFREDGIKKVRRTVDFLAQNTNLIVAVNATGTPYFERQPLRDVVVWYGLGEGIRDGVLKELSGNIKVFDLEDEAGELVSQVVTDFFRTYGAVTLPNGAPGRLALYFPNIETREALRPAVDAALAMQGVATDTVLAVDNKSNESARRAFEALARDPAAPHRVVLLVNMGTEGWNCPSLFACALVRKLASSNNFVLQAATRCLRQVPGNPHPARVYLTGSNRKTLEDQLTETFGTTLRELDSQAADRMYRDVVLHKPHLPPLLIKRRVLRVRRKVSHAPPVPLSFARPDVAAPAAPATHTYTLIETDAGITRFQRMDAGDETVGSYAAEVLTPYSAASRLAANYHLPTAEVLLALRGCYDADRVPAHHLEPLGQQIEAQRCHYEQHHEEIEVAVALVRPDGFDRDAAVDPPVYTARVSFAKDRESLYLMASDTGDAALALDKSFHYEGYNFDSGPEREFLQWALEVLRNNAHQVDGLWFTGGFTDPGKTDLLAEYLGEDGRWHHYTPDFVIRRNDGKHLVVEVKQDVHSPAIHADLMRLAAGQEPLSLEGRKAVALKRWEQLNPDRLTYHVMFAAQKLADAGKPRVRDFMLGLG